MSSVLPVSVCPAVQLASQNHKVDLSFSSACISGLTRASSWACFLKECLVCDPCSVCVRVCACACVRACIHFLILALLSYIQSLNLILVFSFQNSDFCSLQRGASAGLLFAVASDSSLCQRSWSKRVLPITSLTIVRGCPSEVLLEQSSSLSGPPSQCLCCCFSF